ncbi:MAG: NUDIX hydrolase [Bradymonadia bacterium]
MPYTYEYPRAALAVDCVVFGLDAAGLQVLLIERGLEPFKGQWALPGGFVRLDETLDEAARRELEEETGVKAVYLEQLYSFSGIERDPRERVISVAYYALVKLSDHAVHAATDANDAQWFAASELPDLAFDHDRIIDTALTRLRGKVRYQPVGFDLLPTKFTLTELQRLYEIILGRELDKRNFRKKINSMNLLEALDEHQRGVAHRAARLYRFDRARYDELVERGFNFEI